MRSNAERLRQQETRARSCAALVLRFHAGLRDPAPLPAAPARRARPPRLEVHEPELEDDGAGERSRLGSALAVLAWIAGGALIIATWVLLLTG
jgi:hypothetical protein